MPPENLYAAPQSSLTPQPERELQPRTRSGDRERSAVFEGTRLLLNGTWCTLACIIVAILGVMILNLGLLAAMAILVLLLIAAICHGRGLYELQGAAAETRSRGLLTLSLTTYFIAVVCNILEAVAKASRMGSMGMEFNLGQAILSLVMYSTLAWALVRIARYYHEDGARWSAQVALGIILLCYGSLILFYLAILTPAGQEWLRTWREPEGRRLAMTILVAGATLGIAGFVFYTRSLWLLQKGMRDS